MEFILIIAILGCKVTIIAKLRIVLKIMPISYDKKCKPKSLRNPRLETLWE
jgi:hypothetical protein